MDAVQKIAIYNDRYFAGSDGFIYNRAGKRLSGGRNSKGYLCVSLLDGSSPKKPRSFLVHRLVAQAFLGESRLTVNHIDGNKLNNELSNLEYLSVADNTRHAAKVLKAYSGEKNGRCKLTSSQVVEIKMSVLSHIDLSDAFGVSADYIRSIRRGLYRVHG
jgi:hypothetical protein